jgi:hypothetical protein
MRYIHYKNGKIYKTIKNCFDEERVFIQENQEWKEGIIYTEEGGDKLFVRSLEEFNLKFREV